MRLMSVKRASASALACLTLLSGVCAVAQTKTPAANPNARLQSAYARLPLSFEPNRGQTDKSVQFVAKTPQASVFLTGSDAVLETMSFRKDAHGEQKPEAVSAVRMHLAGAAALPLSITEQPLVGTVNYLKGNDASKWHTEVPTSGGVRLSAVYPGVDLKYYGHAGQLEYDFVVAPNADASVVKLQFQGTEAKLDKQGDLLLPTGIGKDLRFDKPVAYQTINGVRVSVDAAFSVAENKDVTFQLGSYDHARELVIDPTLIYLGTMGSGIAQTDVSQITVDNTGALYFTGTTNETTFPATAGSYQVICGPANSTAAANNVTYCNGTNYTSAYVAKLSADGTRLIYSTFLSGHGGYERGGAIAVDSAGVAYLFGATASNDFPVTADAFQKNCYNSYGAYGTVNPVPCDGFYNGGGTQYTIGNQDAFLVKLNATGTALLYSSYLGGAQSVYPVAMALDGGGNIYLYGQTTNLTANNRNNNLGYTGITTSGFQTVSTATTQGNNSGTYNIDIAPFLSKFSNDGHTLLYGTFFDDNVAAVGMNPTAMTVGGTGIAYIAGYSSASNQNNTAGVIKGACTLVNPNSTSSCTTTDAFLAAIDTTKSGADSLAWSTRIGGTDTTQGSNIPQQQILGLTLDSNNNVYATGYTFDHGFPVGAGGYQSACPNYNASQSTYDYCDSAFVIKVNSTGTQILAGTFLGGPTFRSAESVGYNVRLDSKGQVYLYGRSNDGGGDFPQVNPLQGYKGGNQLFISTFSADLSKLLFSTRFGNPSYTDGSVIVAGGMVLGSDDTIYFAGTTKDTMFAGTTGTYNTATATGQGDHTFFAKLSKVLQPDTTVLTITPSTVNQGGSLTFKATVAGTQQTTPVATGMVTFTFTNTTPATTVGTASLDGSGVATFTGTAPTSGTYTVTATYAGDANYDVSTSTASILTVAAKAATTNTVTSSAASVTTGTSVTFTSTITSSATGTPTGTVTFFDGQTQLGPGTLNSGTATYATSALMAGTHSITAVYAGDTAFAGSTSAAFVQTIVAPPPATIALSASPATLTVTRGSSGTVTITATPSGNYTGALAFTCGSLPTYATCTFAPTTLTFAASTAAQTTTLTFRTNNTTAQMLPMDRGNHALQVLAAMLFLPMGIAGFALRRKTGRQLQQAGLLMLFLALSCAAAIMTGCGGSSSTTSNPGTTTNTPAGTYTVPVTATANGATSNVNVTVIVQ